MKNSLTVRIEKGSEQYGAWCEEIPGIYGSADTVREVKKDIVNAIILYKELNSDLPDILKDEFELNWEFDTPSMLEYISHVFTKSGLEKITGINQKQLWHYYKGMKKPRKKQIEKIEKGIHDFIDDLAQIHLI